MKHTPMPSQSGPKSAFTELLESKNTVLSDFRPKPRLVFLPEAVSFFLFPKLIPNCLLTRYPILFIQAPDLSLLHSKAVNWLCLNLYRHGYQAQSCKVEDLDEVIIESLKWQTPQHVFLFSKNKLDISHIHTKTKIHTLKHFETYKMSLLTKPLSNLSKLLETANSLAEKDHQ